MYNNITIEPKVKHYANFSKKIKDLSAEDNSRNYKDKNANVSYVPSWINLEFLSKHTNFKKVS